ncbi:MAG TPA: dihydrolipoamide succinyltransferase [Cytophagales bacterium]|jgi:2-oxoglutarate dehydrogenase E2 component (dihydrolipoamide succinyltransferase)|nr:dihydrolipoamide succinyltransferase [Cytophagales bacterium]
MNLEIKVPSVGESITEVTVAQWVKQDGDYVEMDEVICELESDKATFELTAEASGKLQTNAEEGDTLEVGAVICHIDTEAKGDQQQKDKGGSKKEEDDTDDEGGASKKESSSDGPKKTGEVIEMKVPAVGESITEVTISSWSKNTGDYVELDEVIAEIESDKATFELTAEADGFLEVLVEEGETVDVGTLLCKIEVAEGGTVEDSGNEDKAREKDTSKEDEKEGEESYATGHASPAAAKILNEKGISPEEVKGTGKDGRITKEDAMKAEKKASEKQEQKKEEKTGQDTPQKSSASGDREQRRQKMSQLRKTISRRLVSVKNETAMLTTFNEVNMKPVMDIRKKYKEMFKEKYDINLGFMSFFAKACCMALKEWPAVNAMIDGDEMVYNDFCDISIAVSTPKGLVVPVIRNAENMSFDEIEKEIIRLATRARDGKLSIDEMQGGTFTITNGGVFGSMMSTPIINAPQSAILGMHNIVQRPMAVDGEVVILPMMYIALSYDHRIIDGRESVSFLVRVKELLEDPTRLLLGI